MLQHIERIIANEGLTKVDLTVIISGDLSGRYAEKLRDELSEKKLLSIASYPGFESLDNIGLDEFNIGIVMHPIPPDEFVDAFWAKVARLNGAQTPLIWMKE